MPGTLFVVATPIGNLEDITVRALRVLRDVALIAAEDTRRTARLLARHAIATPTTSLHEHNEARKSPSILARLRAGEDIALVSDAGTPTVSDPGTDLIRQAYEAGIRVEPVPGPSAVTAALSICGLSTDRFAFFGFPPTSRTERSIWFEQVTGFNGVVVFFEAPHRIRLTLEELQRVAGDTPVCITRELTKFHEELVKGPISVVLPHLATARGEYTVIASIGLSPDITPVEAPAPDQLAAEFGEMTKICRSSRRQAVASLARKYGLRVNDVYKALEGASRIGRTPD
jgi:16S rRNA (cytidine1402-2'-O)-methyltransferase